MKTNTLILLSLMTNFAMANERKTFICDVFDKKGQIKKFICEQYQKKENKKIIDRRICKDLNGKILVVEKIERKQNRLVRYDIDQKQLKQKARIELKDDKVIFNLKGNNKKTERKIIDKPENFIVGMQIVPFIIKHWKALAKGERKEIKLAVWNEQKVFSFYLSREKMDEQTMLIRMRPSNFLARLVLGSFYFTMGVKDKVVLQYKGRTNLKEKRDNSYRDYEGLVYYKSL